MSRVADGLSRALNGPFTVHAILALDTSHRIVVLSDQHKGAGDGADDFRQCKPAYIAALQHYLDNDFTLVLLGDAEELWEQGFREVERAHGDVMRLEASFPASRHYRLWGNHDDMWMSDRKVAKHLSSYLPSGRVHEGIRFSVSRDARPCGTLLLLHGHQGTTFSDKLSWAARLFLPLYRFGQRVFGFGKTTPAADACLRGAHDKEMYEWAAAQDDLILIAGHTHRPVWSSQTHLQQLEFDLASLLNEPDSDNRLPEIQALEEAIDKRKQLSRPCNDEMHSRPVYFNTGCCRFSDGDITGLELEDGELRLVKWSSAPTSGTRIELESGKLSEFFELVANASSS